MQLPTLKNPYSQGSLYEFMFKIHKIRSQKMYKPMAAVSQCSVEESACEPLFASDVNAPLTNSLSQKKTYLVQYCALYAVYIALSQYIKTEDSTYSFGLMLCCMITKVILHIAPRHLHTTQKPGNRAPPCRKNSVLNTRDYVLMFYTPSNTSL